MRTVLLMLLPSTSATTTWTRSDVLSRFMPVNVRTISGHGYYTIAKLLYIVVPTSCPYTIAMKKKSGRPKMPAGAVKADYIEVRCGEAEKRAFRAAAEAAGLPLSGWIRERLRRMARKELEGMDMPVPFLNRLSA